MMPVAFHAMEQIRGRSWPQPGPAFAAPAPEHGAFEEFSAGLQGGAIHQP